eukprot:TRINITY_DN20796_c0_g1_i1.p1 TRINITY_DN20796_c0_g1~~TRINITY_DN20796_c0_g1_i1.p1  ORF type:complete len:540 (+),score=167.42 TRINITY_DN20796_c0_g1_i1:68-1687(+)
MFLAAVTALALAQLPKPTPDQLIWASDELTNIGHFNMGTYQACGIGSTTLEGTAENMKSIYLSLPPPETFAPTNVTVEQWIQALKSYGSKHAVLVVSHGCGFNTFPSNTAFPEFGFVWNYSVKSSPWMNGKGDIAADFVAMCKKYDIKPGFYHGAMNNAFLNVVKGVVQPNPIPGQANITQDQYTQILLANLRQLWTDYGQLAEVWFDGGYPAGTEQAITQLLAELQPSAVAFQGPPPNKNIVRWAGTESGHVTYPFWSTAANSMDDGQGSPDGAEFVPGEADTCFQTPPSGASHGERAPYGGCWFYNAGDVPKSLEELVSVYHDSVGSNANLLLDWTPDQTGALPEAHVQRYQEFGDWLRACYSTPVVEAVAPQGGTVTLQIPSGAEVDRVVIMEDQTNGQAIRGYEVSVDGAAMGSGSSVGHKRIQFLSKRTTGTTFVLNVTQAAATPVLARVGLYNCSRTPTPTGCNYQEDFAYKIVPDIVISTTKGTTLQNCCTLARSAPSCSVFVFDTDKTCTLLSANQGGDASTGAVSGAPLR